MLKTAAVTIFTAISLLGSALADSPAAPDDVKATKYRSMQIDGLTVAYREAGPPEAPTVLLLHGFPSSSRMYQRLFPLLSDRYHLVAPDYVGFGQSDAPDPSHFDYTFDHLADIVAKMVGQMGLTHYTLFMQDYGGPIGFRLALRKPEAVDAMIVQNAVAHEQGLGPLWAARRAFWADRAANEAKLRASFLSFEATKSRHLGSSPRPELYDPDAWTDEFAFLERPGEADIQTELFYDYRNNVASYPAWQAVRTVEFANAQRPNREGVHARARSTSYLPQEGAEAIHLHDALDRLFEQHAVDGAVTMRLKTIVTIADRNT